MTIIPIDFDRRQANHPSKAEFKKQVPDRLSSWHPCSAQLNLAVNKSDDPIVKYDYPDPVTSKSCAWKSKTGHNYLMAVHDRRIFLTTAYEIMSQNASDHRAISSPAPKGVKESSVSICFTSMSDPTEGSIIQRNSIFRSCRTKRDRAARN